MRSPGRVPAIDGLRGFALLGMLAWHAQVGWVKGGFARMTIFFVLSGYLATASLLALRAERPTGAFRQFWLRRARRLLPVSLLGVGFAMVTAVVLDGSARATLRGDALSVIANVSNWRFLQADAAYGELFERPSPFQHFWSLSLEEQCFWLLPLVLAGIGLLTRHRAWLVAAALAVALAAIPLVIAHSPDAAYYGTHVRGGEFLAGAALALALHRYGGRAPDRALPALRWLGAGSLGVLVIVMLAVERDLPWLYQGGMGLFAIPAVLVVVAALDEHGPVQWLLSAHPLARVGRWAFPIYVLHWPVFLLLSPERMGFGGAPLVALQLAVSIALGAVVHHHFERPLMQRRWASPGKPLLAGIGVATAALLAVAILAPLPAPTHDLAGDLAAAELRANQGDGSQVGAGVGLFGGSTAVALGAAAHDWTPSSPGLRSTGGSALLGCGLLTEGERVYGWDDLTDQLQLAPPDDHCLDWPERWPTAIEAGHTQVALVMGGVWDTTDWQLPDSDGFRSIRDPELSERLRERLAMATDLLAERGAHVVLATTPEVGQGITGAARNQRGLGDDHPDRVQIYNALVAQVAEERPYASIIDYGSFINGLDPDLSGAWLPDGIHPTPEAAVEIWSVFLGPQLEALLGPT